MKVENYPLTPGRDEARRTGPLDGLIPPNEYVRFRQFIGGAKTFLFGANQAKDRDAPACARYCYSVWLRHLSHAATFGARRPAKVVELGPGRSIGVGIAALLCGARAYHALDVLPSARPSESLSIADELADLLRRRSAIPAPDEFPNLRPPLPSYDFPASILGDELLEASLRPQRLRSLREAIVGLGGDQTPQPASMELRYVTDSRALDWLPGSVDLVLSQAVMQYAEDLDEAYRDHYRWLRPGGLVSHQIDLSAHETAVDWNAHWAISDLEWRVMRGRKPFFLNRQPYSVHLQSIRRAGFEVLSAVRGIAETGIDPRRLSRRFAHLRGEDLRVRAAYILARKPASP